MIDDFRRPPERKPVRIDPFDRPRPLGDFNQPSVTPIAPLDPPAVQSAWSAQTQPASYGYSAPPVSSPELQQQPLDLDGVDRAGQSGGRFALFQKLRRLSRKQAVALGLGVALLLGGGAYALTRPEPPPAQKPKATIVAPKPAPKPITSPLTGLVVTPEQQARPVTSVMIENSPDARPQSGLKEAGVVFEAIAEAGITRFLTLYQESAPGNIGPIRSARPYFLDWAMPFDAAYAHVGGSPDALQRIKEIGVKDLDQFHNPGAYHRIKTRYAPHNVYSSMDALVKAGTARGYTKSTFTGFERKTKEEPSKAPTARAITMGISGAYYNVRYEYDPATNAYKRTMGGTPHVDMESKAQLEPKVVVGLAMPYGLMADGYHTTYTTTGTGLAYFFQDGNVTPGSWTKADHKSQFVFKDNAGNPVKLNPGQTWLTVVGDPAKVSYTP